MTIVRALFQKPQIPFFSLSFIVPFLENQLKADLLPFHSKKYILVNKTAFVDFTTSL